MRIGQIGVDLERLLSRRGGLRWVLTRQRARDPHVRRGPVACLLEDLLKRLQRFGGIVSFEEEIAPRHFDCGVGAASRHAIEGVRVLHPPEGLRRSRGAENRLAVGDLQASAENPAEVAGRDLAPPEVVLQQQSQREGRLARGICRGRRLEQLQRLVVASTRRRQLCEHGRRFGVARRPGLRQCLSFAGSTARECPPCLLDERFRRLSRGLGTGGFDDGPDGRPGPRP